MLSVNGGVLVLLKLDPEQQESFARRAERYGVPIVNVASFAAARQRLQKTARSVLILNGLDADALSEIRALRKQAESKGTPVLALLPDDKIDDKLMEQANKLQIELVPESTPELRRWERARVAYDLCKSGKRQQVVNRRAHFRLPLNVKATLISAVETVDISLGGVAFMTNVPYKIGDFGKIDIRSLLGDMDEDERGFSFEVVAIKRLSKQPYKFLVGAKFVGISDNALQRLHEALELIEPTSMERS